MPQRLDEFNKKFIYTETNPENIISARKNALFFRKGKEFYVNHSGAINTKWEKLPYKTVIIPPPPKSKLIKYKKEYELWLKTTDGYYNEFEELMPKTGWRFLNNKDIFIGAKIKHLNWVFPVPTSSNDPVGNNNSRSYDENFFYAKLNGKWYRTPIAVFNSQGNPSPDNPALSNYLPFVDTPRFLPVPSNSDIIDQAPLGEQTYDADYFYIKPSIWKRSVLSIYYDANKMARF